MNKIAKILITVAVFTFIILYFIKGKEPVGPIITENTECERLNEILKVKIQDYFSENLPTEDGIIKSVEITELINNKILTSSDLSEVGTSCSGNIYATRSGTNYYYSNDIVCGACNINDLYGEWSEYTENKPNTSKTDAQVQTNLYYNYSDATPEYTPWTEWVEISDTKTSPVIPSGVQVIDTETEEKIQYSYRDGNFKWYKLEGGASYYDGGTLVEKSPGNGYSKVEESKTYSRTIGPDTNRSNITSQTSGLVYDMETNTSYRTREVKNIYSRTVSGNKCTAYYQNCTCNMPTYKCCKSESTGTSYTCSKINEYTKDYYTYDYNAAYNDCIATGGCIRVNTNTQTSTSGGTYKYTLTFDLVNSSGQKYYCELSCDYDKYYPTNNMPMSCTMDKMGSVMSAYECLVSSGKVRTHWCKRSTPSLTLYWKTTNCNGTSAANGNVCITGFSGYNNNVESCVASRSTISSGTTTTTTTYGYTYSQTSYLYGQSSCPSGYAVVNSQPTGTYQSCQNNEVTSNNECPSGYTATLTGNYKSTIINNQTSCTSGCTSTQTQNCIPGSSVSNPTVYYIKDKTGATTTNLNEAIYLSESEYANIGLTTYSPDNSKTQYTSWSSYKTGSCPNSISTSTCDQATSYQAKIYKFKWYKTSTASKSWYNSGEYLSYSPGSGYNADTGSAKWGKWTDYSDDKVEKSDTREVRTKTLKRMRTSYLAEESLKLETWLPLSEFETKMGKTLAELSLDKNIKIQKKVFYRFRLIKE